MPEQNKSLNLATDAFNSAMSAIKYYGYRLTADTTTDNRLKLGLEPIPKDEEQIMVVPIDKIEGLYPPKGISKNQETMIDVVAAEAVFRSRGVMETDFGYKQIIPYCIVKMIDGDKTKYLRYKRTVESGENRLHNKMSIGIGGHVNNHGNEIHDNITILTDSVSRELKEELGVNFKHASVDITALLNDDSNDVGKVHLGLVFEFVVDTAEWLEGLDKGLSHIEFLDESQLIMEYDQMETWSQIIIKDLLELIDE